MLCTVIIKDKTDSFYDSLAAMPDADKFKYLSKMHSDPYAMGVTLKIGTSNAFRDKVELNQTLRTQCVYNYKLESRKGYKLATFNITKG